MSRRIREFLKEALLLLLIMAVSYTATGFVARQIRRLRSYPEQESIVYQSKGTLDPEAFSFHRQAETVMLFQDEVWKQLDREQKCEALQKLLDIETARLGLPEELDLVVCALEGNLGGWYRAELQLVAVNARRFDQLSAQSLLRIVCHEAYHAYQHWMVEVYEKLPKELRSLRAFYDVAVYRWEFQNYVSNEEDLEAYQGQRCERDADAYAEEEVQAILHYIELRKHVTGTD